MNQFDNAKYLQIPKLQQVDQAFLQYIDKLYNKYPELHLTDEQWIEFYQSSIYQIHPRYNNIIMNFKIKELHNSTYNTTKYNGTIMFLFIKCDTIRLQNIISHLAITRIYHLLEDIEDIFYLLTANPPINFSSICNLWNICLSNVHKYIRMRFIYPAYSIIISYLISINAKLINSNKLINRFITNYNLKQHTLYKVNNEIDKNLLLDDYHYLFSLVKTEYIEKMKPIASEVYQYFEKQFIMNPNRILFEKLLEIDLEPINNECSMAMINFLKKEIMNNKDLLINGKLSFDLILERCILSSYQQEMLKSYRLLYSI